MEEEGLSYGRSSDGRWVEVEMNSQVKRSTYMMSCWGMSFGVFLTTHVRFETIFSRFQKCHHLHTQMLMMKGDAKGTKDKAF